MVRVEVMRMNEIERMVRTILLTHGETRKIPIDQEDLWCYDYEESYIIQKRMRHKELREHIMEKGCTREQAEEMILDCWVRGVIGRVSVDLDNCESKDKDEYVMANEEYWVEDETDSLGCRVVDEFMNSEVREYVTEYPFFDDEDEEKLREVYFEHNEKYLSRNQLIKGLMGKGYTEKRAQEIIEKYTTKEIEKKIEDWWDEYKAENLFKRPKYKPLKHHENKRIVKRIVKGNSEDFIITEIPDCYEIMQIEEWLLEEYEDLIGMRRDGWHTFGVEKVPLRTIRKIFREAEKQGKETLTQSELKQKIIEECKATEEEVETAIYGVLRTFKIRRAIPPRETWDIEPAREKEYYWSGTSCKYPPLTLQDKVLNPIKKVFKEVQEQGKEVLTWEELVEKALKAYQKHKENREEETYTETVNREYVEMMIEEAEELLLITSEKEQNGETTYRLNHQVLKNKKTRTQTKCRKTIYDK